MKKAPPTSYLKFSVVDFTTFIIFAVEHSKNSFWVFFFSLVTPISQ